MGLGLTICEGIIRVHGGRIWAEPNSPRGVAFLFSLPIDQPQPSMPRELAAPAELPGAAT
jgi:K+-sensing histidine kinase KdpD